MSRSSFRIAWHIFAHLLTLTAVMLTVRWGGNLAAQSTDLVISSVSISGSNLLLTGSGAVSGSTYYVLASTNLSLVPVTQWNAILTSAFPATGAFTSSIPVNFVIPQEFFAIAMPLPYMIGTSSSPTNGGSTSGGGTVPAGSSVTVCATANGCYSFVSWTDPSSNVVSTSACYNFTASTNLNLVANFAPISYVIGTSSSPTNGGSISGGGTVACQSNVTVCATANGCYNFVSWTDPSSNVVSTSACYNFTASTNLNLVANFAPISYVLGTSSSPTNGGSISGGGTVACQSNVTVCATPNSCYSFVNWTDPGSNVVSTSACYNFTAVSNRTLVANFAPISYVIGTSSSPTNGGSISGGGTVACQSNVTVCATPNSCYSFVNWTDPGSNVVSTSACYNFTAVSNRTLVANFAPISYVIGTSSSPTNGGSISGGGTVACQSNVLCHTQRLLQLRELDGPGQQCGQHQRVLQLHRCIQPHLGGQLRTD
jgi:hypothetical protein